jgi:hypothetical protein
MLSALWSDAQELDFFVRSAAADGRLLIVAEDSAWLPRLSVWSANSLKRLEQQWNRTIPFETEVPLRLMMGGDTREIVLGQLVRRGVLQQRISLPAAPEDVYAMPLGERFVEAMLSRVFWSEGLLEDGAIPAPEVNWMKGAAATLVDLEARRLAAVAVSRFAERAPPSPELVRGEEAMESFLLYRWIQQTLLKDGGTSRIFWQQLHERPDFRVEEWVEVTPEVGTLRQLHIRWEVWWAAERQRLISEYGLRDEAVGWLLEELNPVPRFLGVGTFGPDDLRTTSFQEFEPYLDHPDIETALVQWMLRIQRVRFRQAGDLNTVMSGFEEALLEAVRAVRAQGATRRFHWKEAVGMWDTALQQL